MKTCIVCDTKKPLSEFYRNRAKPDGLDQRCKDCAKAAARLRNVTVVMTHEYPRGTEPKRCRACGEVKPALAFGTHKRNRDGLHARCRACRAAKEMRDKQTERTRRYREQNPDKARARGLVGNAVRRGKMPAASSLPCAHCGAQAQHYHHHKGYDRVHCRDVVPVCAVCHGLLELSR